jgi:hypothetical protein
MNETLQLTVSAGLDGSLNVTDALDGHTVLVVTVDELVLELTDLVDEHTELVGNIGNVVIEALAPDRELLLYILSAVFREFKEYFKLTATSMRSRPTSSMERMTFFSIFTSWESFFARSGPKAPGWTDLRKLWPVDIAISPCWRAELSERDIAYQCWPCRRACQSWWWTMMEAGSGSARRWERATGA